MRKYYPFSDLGRNKQSNICICCALAFVLFILTITGGCLHFSDYVSFRDDKGLAHFSFEHPRSYSAAILNSGSDYVAISLQGPYNKDVEDRTIISLLVTTPGDGIRDLNSAVQFSISLASKEPGYKLIAQSSVMIAGEKGQQIIYFYMRTRPSIGEPGYIPGLGPAPTIIREVLFERNSLIWSIRMNSNEATYSSDDIYFEHLLETFKILD